MLVLTPALLVFIMVANVARVASWTKLTSDDGVEFSLGLFSLAVVVDEEYAVGALDKVECEIL